MTNKRITELTALDGDDVADNDVLAIVDVSDTTMAASGTTKKITVAELITDSAINNRFVQSSVLTTNDDILTRAAGVPARITRANLAADTAFTSRYVPTSTETVFIAPGSFTVWSGATLGTSGSPNSAVSAAVFADSGLTGVTANAWIPDHWATYHIDLLWLRAGASGGDVRWQLLGASPADNATTDSNAIGESVTATANAQWFRTTTRLLASTTLLAGNYVQFWLRRDGDDAADTLSGNAMALGLVLVRAT